jgi:hypothetical protein
MMEGDFEEMQNLSWIRMTVVQDKTLLHVIRFWKDCCYLCSEIVKISKLEILLTGFPIFVL